MIAVGNYTRTNGGIKDFNSSLEHYYMDMEEEYKKNDTDLKNFISLNLAFLCINNKYAVNRIFLKELMEKLPASSYLWYTAEGIRAQTGIYVGLGKFKLNKNLLLSFFEKLIADCLVSERKPWQLLLLVNNPNE